jgi:hypothetical protein
LSTNPKRDEVLAAQRFYVEHFGNINHPTNGIRVGRNPSSVNKYKGLAKGSSHSNNTIAYENEVAMRILKVRDKCKGKSKEYTQQALLECLDEIKKDIYTGKLAIGGDSHTKHTAFSIFK